MREELKVKLKKNNNLEHNCDDYRKQQGEGQYDRCGYCGCLIHDD